LAKNERPPQPLLLPIDGPKNKETKAKKMKRPRKKNRGGLGPRVCHEKRKTKGGPNKGRESRKSVAQYRISMEKMN